MGWLVAWKVEADGGVEGWVDGLMRAVESVDACVVEGGVGRQGVWKVKQTCPPEDGVVEEGELHLCVVLQ